MQPQLLCLHGNIQPNVIYCNCTPSRGNHGFGDATNKGYCLKPKMTVDVSSFFGKRVGVPTSDWTQHIYQRKILQMVHTLVGGQFKSI